MQSETPNLTQEEKTNFIADMEMVYQATGDFKGLYEHYEAEYTEDEITALIKELEPLCSNI